MNEDHGTLLNIQNLPVLEDLYDRFLADPGSVPDDWREFFSSLETLDKSADIAVPKLTKAERGAITDFPVRVLMLMQGYRRHGHYNALTDPLGLRKPKRDSLHLEDYGLSAADLDRPVKTMYGGKEVTATLGELIARMEKMYCSSMGIEFFYIRDESRRDWMIRHMEVDESTWAFSTEERVHLFEKLYAAEYFERFLGTRFPGKKRFSLEGGESLIPTMAAAIEHAGAYGVKQMVIGMAHRGRLNILANILGKDPALIFAEFNENVPDTVSAGDVKYHMGYSNDVKTRSGADVHLSLGFNPSHLEVINPVVMGSVRARQTREGDVERDHHVAFLIHGDAAFAGQGINYECINMASLPGYYIGGTVHIVVNNQIGFTTMPEESRSTPYATDLAKLLQVPIFHVNGDDPEACARAVKVALDFRQKYNTDAFIDLICYRRWGHNETDEPAFTQPVMYSKIKSHPTTVTLYEERLLREGVAPSLLEAAKKRVQDHFESAYNRLQSEPVDIQVQTMAGSWTGFRKEDHGAQPNTALDADTLRFIGQRVTSHPADFKPHARIQKLLDTRRSMLEPGGRIDWGMGEMLAYGSLLLDKINIRFSGQDVKRGTFSHRHAVLFDVDSAAEHTPLNHLKPGSQGNIEIVNSLLSEEAVLGFEFGYSLADPRALVIWEAQFGDFANGAQVIIDQFITSCEAKWSRMSGLVMLLPHGYEGQGPEHSSARMERYLQLCSQNNIQVVNATSPAQIFHLLRRQMLRNFRKPLVVMSPKSLLRLPEATSSLEEFTSGEFREIIDDVDPLDPAAVDRVVLCSGKIYYELLAARRAAALTNVAIVRVEQLYPYPFSIMADLVQKYESASHFAWVQEEPRNQGAWSYIENHIAPQLSPHMALRYIGRVASPSPATGYHKVHQREQEDIIRAALRVRSRVRKEVTHGH